MLKGFKEFVLGGTSSILPLPSSSGSVQQCHHRDGQGSDYAVIGAIVGKTDFSAWVVTVNGSPFLVAIS